MEIKFLKCEHCGKIVLVINDTKVPAMCCGKKMEEIIPGVVEASHEKHIPVYVVKDNKVEVNVGSVDHPMIEAHYIEWILLKTKFGSQFKKLEPNEEPKALFAINEGDEVEAVYAYCNLHGLWVAR